jgi:hypothetical protein
MKKFSFLSILTLSSLFVNNCFATIRTVNNNNPSPGQYTIVQTAITASATGDTIYITGSSASYNSFSVDKTLVFIGTGHKPQNQNTSVSTVDNITLTTTAASGSKFLGLNMNYFSTNVNSVTNILIERCLIRAYINVNNYSHSYWYILGNVFTDASTNINFNNTGSFNHVFIKNNAFNGVLNELSYSTYNTDIYVQNNLFLKNGNAFAGNNYYINIYNNIFYRANTVPATIGCVWQRNTSYQSQADGSFPSGTNLTNTNPLFVNFPGVGDNYDYAYNFNLQSTSPLINYGIDGTNANIYGGDVFFEKNGIPPIPQIRELNILTPTVAAGGTLNINFKSTIKQ